MTLLTASFSKPYFAHGIIIMKGGYHMPKDILGNEFENVKPTPPHDGFCPKCKALLQADILGNWYCIDDERCSFSVNPE